MAVAALEQLARCLERLPGVGRRSAERMAMRLAADPDRVLAPLMSALDAARRTVRFCSRCGSVTDIEHDPCLLCMDPTRDDALLCVVETPEDIISVERSHGFRGRYHALMGKLSPGRGEGPDNIRFRELMARVAAGGIAEVVLALDGDLESDATARFVAEQLGQQHIKVTRLAYGLPIGSGIKHLDALTLERAFEGRQSL